MKNHNRILAMILLCSLVGWPLRAQEDLHPLSPPDVLNVQTDVPTAWDSFLEDNIAEALVAQIRWVFRRQGFEGEVVEIDRFEDPVEDAPRLHLVLTEWRINRTGMVQCTMRGTFSEPGGQEQNLGTLTATEFTWEPRSRWSLAESFRKAARDVARDLWDELEGTSVRGRMTKASGSG